MAEDLDWDTIVAHALSLSGTELGTHYGKPAVKANGRALIGTSREADSFVLHIDQDTKAMLMATEPETYWQTPHYEGWPTVLVRYAAKDWPRLLAMLERARDQALASPPPRTPKK